MGFQFFGAQNGVNMGVLNAPRRAIWICSVVSLTAFLIFLCFPVSSFHPLSVPWPLVCMKTTSTCDANDGVSYRNPIVSPSAPPPQTTDTFSVNCHKKPRPEAYQQHGNGTESFALPKLMAELWKPLVHPITERVFVTDKGERFEVPIDQVRWKKPLGKRVLIVDTDTRLDGKTENTMLNEFRAADYPDRHGTWVKPAITKEALKTHDFVISLDSDAVFTHLDLPLEWLMNLWDYRPETLVAMAYDLDWEQDYDPQGNLILNTGFVIAQASQRTQDMFQRWEDCPRSIPGCDHWNHKWAHEQSAFSYYIRYEFNRTHDVINIPCNQANGNEFTLDGNGECKGVFQWLHSKTRWDVYQELSLFEIKNLASIMSVAVTDAASGIGLAVAKFLASRRAQLSLADLNKEGLEAALEALLGDGHIINQVDVCDSQQVNTWIEKTVSVFGKLEGAVNMAGVFTYGTCLRDETDNTWDFIMGINARGVFNCLRAELNCIKSGGSIADIDPRLLWNLEASASVGIGS
ncbi:hypothetical protein FCIRC_5818 [Fusarium circinatum]|uniref:Nucleotide-diphospho-sugar transferase domain-containing protein n=1 Tax=Fusarium circinatum TaxID=48490 RepID=A0A8H5TY43_FUSCI|nr:hypothetical protein FCIRC_5818 [Fusarium circinatum]